jgi:hypothetical protein
MTVPPAAAALAAETAVALESTVGGEALLHRLSRRPAFGRLLDAVLDDERYAAGVAARSYRHALGFDKLILAPVPPLGQLRLHVWWPDDERRREHVHNHRFAFSSVVVAGLLRTHLYQQDEAGTAMPRYRETSDPGSRRWRFEAVGSVRLGTCLVADQPPGTAYTMSPELLHRIEASPVLTATLFLETRQCRPWSWVFTEPGAEPPRAAPQTALTVAGLRERLVRLRAAVDGLPG